MANKNPVKPPPKCSEKQVICAVKKHGGLLYLVAQELKVTKQTVRNYVKKWPEVKRAVREARGKRLDLAEKTIDMLVRKGDFKASAYLLDRQGQKRGYGKQQEIRLGGSATAPPIRTESAISLDQLSLEARKMILAELRAKKEAEQNKVTNGL